MAMPPALNVATNPMAITGLDQDMREEHYFREVFRYAPLGVKSRAMMTHMIGAVRNQRRIEDGLFNFYEKPFNQRDTAVIDVYDGPGLTTATTAGGAAGATRVIAVTAANAKIWEVGMHVVLTKFNDAAFKQYVATAKGKITGKSVGSDTTSYLTIVLSQADSDNACSGTYLRINPGGQSHHNIHTLPESHVEKPTKFRGACSTFLGSYSMDDMTRTTKLRVDYDVWREAEMDGLKDFFIDKEGHFLEGVFDEDDPEELVAGGLEYYMETHAVAGRNIINAITDTTYLASSVTGPSYTWIYELLEGVMEYASRYRGDEDLRCFHGGQAGIVINRMIRDKGVYNIGQTTERDEFGFVFNKLTFQSGGTLRFYEHPLFKNAPRYQATMIIPNLENITQVTRMRFENIPADVMNEERSRRARRDGTVWSSVAKGGFREVCGWKFNAVNGMFIIRNVHPDLSRV